MPYKLNSAGKLQAYDPNTGKYIRMLPDWMIQKPDPAAEKRLKKAAKHERRQMELDYRAAHSKDRYLYDAYLAIKHAFKNRVIHVNHFYKTEDNKIREVDIVTQRTIIEVKSGTVHHKAPQLLAQKKYAASRKKQHIVYAPDIAYGTKIAYSKMGLTIATSKQELINYLKEYEK